MQLHLLTSTSTSSPPSPSRRPVSPRAPRCTFSSGSVSSTLPPTLAPPSNPPKSLQDLRTHPPFSSRLPPPQNEIQATLTASPGRRFRTVSTLTPWATLPPFAPSSTPPPSSRQLLCDPRNIGADLAAYLELGEVELPDDWFSGDMSDWDEEGEDDEEGMSRGNGKDWFRNAQPPGAAQAARTLDDRAVPVTAIAESRETDQESLWTTGNSPSTPSQR